MWNRLLESSYAQDILGPRLAFIGGLELWIPLGVLVLFFGGRKLPELARAMGSSINQFKRGLETDEDSPNAIDSGGGAPTVDSSSSAGEQKS